MFFLTTLPQEDKVLNKELNENTFKEQYNELSPGPLIRIEPLWSSKNA